MPEVFSGMIYFLLKTMGNCRYFSHVLGEIYAAMLVFLIIKKLRLFQIFFWLKHSRLSFQIMGKTKTKSIFEKLLTTFYTYLYLTYFCQCHVLDFFEL